jgi:hypothetical protein
MRFMNLHLVRYRAVTRLLSLLGVRISFSFSNNCT